ncbi:putative reverse transcriptase domain-containing protein [Tanacetum coccineum]
MIRMRYDMPPRRIFVLTAPLLRCDVAESSAAAAARPPRGRYDFVDTVEAGQGLIHSPGHDARTIARATDRAEDVGYVRALQASERRMMTSMEGVNLRVSYQAQIQRKESEEFYTQLHDAQTDRRDIRLEIDVVRGQRTAYETELHEVRQAYLSSEAQNRELLARLKTLETHPNAGRVDSSNGIRYMNMFDAQVLARNVPHGSSYSISDNVDIFFKKSHPGHYLCHQVVLSAFNDIAYYPDQGGDNNKDLFSQKMNQTRLQVHGLPDTSGRKGRLNIITSSAKRNLSSRLTESGTDTRPNASYKRQNVRAHSGYEYASTSNSGPSYNIDPSTPAGGASACFTTASVITLIPEPSLICMFHLLHSLKVLLVFEAREIERVERLGAKKGVAFLMLKDVVMLERLMTSSLLSFDQSSPRTHNEVPTLKAYPVCKTVPCGQIEYVYPRPVYEGEFVLTLATPSEPLQNKAHLVIIGHGVDPIQLVVWLPVLCRNMEIPYCIVEWKSR